MKLLQRNTILRISDVVWLSHIAYLLYYSYLTQPDVFNKFNLNTFGSLLFLISALSFGIGKQFNKKEKNYKYVNFGIILSVSMILGFQIFYYYTDAITVFTISLVIFTAITLQKYYRAIFIVIIISVFAYTYLLRDKYKMITPLITLASIENHPFQCTKSTDFGPNIKICYDRFFAGYNDKIYKNLTDSSTLILLDTMKLIQVDHNYKTAGFSSDEGLFLKAMRSNHFVLAMYRSLLFDYSRYKTDSVTYFYSNNIHIYNIQNDSLSTNYLFVDSNYIGSVEVIGKNYSKKIPFYPVILKE